MISARASSILLLLAPALAAAPSTTELRHGDGEGYVLVGVSAGSFKLGSPQGEAGRAPEEARRAARVRERFWIGAAEVSQGLWEEVMGANPVAERHGLSITNPYVKPRCADAGVDPALPVVCVDLYEVAAFCNRLSEREGLAPAYTLSLETDLHATPPIVWDPDADGYRLPTWIEWEYAARAGGESAWALTGDDGAVCAGANVAGAEAAPPPEGAFPCEDEWPALAPVMSGEANAWGLFEVTGNAAEWVWYEREGAKRLGMDAVIARSTSLDRMRRGGGYADGPAAARVAARAMTKAELRWPDTGFRLARRW